MNTYKIKFMGSHETLTVSADTHEVANDKHVFKTGADTVAEFAKDSVMAWWKE